MALRKHAAIREYSTLTVYLTLSIYLSSDLSTYYLSPSLPHSACLALSLPPSLPCRRGPHKLKPATSEGRAFHSLERQLGGSWLDYVPSLHESVGPVSGS